MIPKIQPASQCPVTDPSCLHQLACDRLPPAKVPDEHAQHTLKEKVSTSDPFRKPKRKTYIPDTIELVKSIPRSHWKV